MQLVGPFKVRVDCKNDAGGSVVMTHTVPDDHSGVPFLLALLGETKRKRDKNQLELFHKPPAQGEPAPEDPRDRPPQPDEDGEKPASDPDPGQSVVFPENAESGALSCPDCGSLDVAPTVDPETGSRGQLCDECGCRFAFVCTVADCTGPAGRYGRCADHQPGETRPKRKRTSGRRKKPQPVTGPCGHETTNKTGVCDACFEKELGK